MYGINSNTLFFWVGKTIPLKSLFLYTFSLDLTLQKSLRCLDVVPLNNAGNFTTAR